jgi:phosphoribosylanthranilate isomerase
MILAGGLAAHNVAVAVAAVRPYGVDVSSAVETAPGQKNAKLIENFVCAARAAEKHL